nr:probable transcription factor At3g04930 [Ipomoea batatas]
MASDQHHTVYNDEDLEADDDEESLDRPPTVLDEEDDDEEDVEDDSTSSSNLAAPDPLRPVPPPPAAVMPSSADVTIAVASVRADPIQLNSKRHLDNITVSAAATTVAVVEDKKPSAAFDDSRKLFQRLWTDEDEIELLQGFLEYTAQRGATNSSHHHDTTAFYDQIKSKLQLEFNKNQLVEKLRRLKKKYRNVVSKIGGGKEYVFKSAHDQATFEISSKIWSNCGSAIRGGPVGPTAVVDDGGYEDDYANPNPNQIPNFIDHSPNLNSNSVDMKTPRSRKRSRAGAPVKVEEKQGLIQQHYQPPPSANVATPIANTTAATATAQTVMATPIPSLIEETVKSCLSPVFKELLNNVSHLNGGSKGFGLGLALSPIPLGFGGGPLGAEIMADEKWRKQQILELEVYSKRLALVQDQIKAQLEELRSMGS